MSPPRVLIDSYNLRLETGTGIATYARNLGQSLHALGYQVELLFGSQGTPDNPLLREIPFSTPHRHRVFPPLKWRRVKELLACRSGIEAYPVVVGGKVVSRVFDGRLPHFDGIWNAPHLFEWTHRYYNAFHRPLRVLMPTPPAVVHWTYPLPVKVDGAKNIYTIRDLVPLRLPYTTLESKRRFLGLLNMLRQGADHIVTVSEASKKEIFLICSAFPKTG